jgi:hypothetical protein
MVVVTVVCAHEGNWIKNGRKRSSNVNSISKSIGSVFQQSVRVSRRVAGCLLVVFAGARARCAHIANQGRPHLLRRCGRSGPRFGFENRLLQCRIIQDCRRGVNREEKGILKGNPGVGMCTITIAESYFLSPARAMDKPQRDRIPSLLPKRPPSPMACQSEVDHDQE